MRRRRRRRRSLQGGAEGARGDCVWDWDAIPDPLGGEALPLVMKVYGWLGWASSGTTRGMRNQPIDAVLLQGDGGNRKVLSGGGVAQEDQERVLQAIIRAEWPDMEPTSPAFLEGGALLRVTDAEANNWLHRALRTAAAGGTPAPTKAAAQVTAAPSGNGPGRRTPGVGKGPGTRDTPLGGLGPPTQSAPPPPPPRCSRNGGTCAATGREGDGSNMRADARRAGAALTRRSLTADPDCHPIPPAPPPPGVPRGEATAARGAGRPRLRACTTLWRPEVGREQEVSEPPPRRRLVPRSQDNQSAPPQPPEGSTGVPGGGSGEPPPLPLSLLSRSNPRTAGGRHGGRQPRAPPAGPGADPPPKELHDTQGGALLPPCCMRRAPIQQLAHSRSTCSGPAALRLGARAPCRPHLDCGTRT